MTIDWTIDLKSIILSLSIIISTGISIFFYLKNRTFGFENSLNDRLFKIQDISFKYPFVEDTKFIDGWDNFFIEYRKKESIDYDNDKLTEKYLQYEQYCEMIFNLISDTYSYKKDEEKMLAFISFKAWARTHRNWWKNPLVKHSNQDNYDEEFTIIIDKWLK